MSNFVDFSQYSAENAPEQQRLLEQAYERAQAADKKARGALSKSERDAGAKYGADGQLQGGTSLSQSMSYGDYLQAAKEASTAWAAVTQRSMDPRAAALQGTMGQDFQQKARGAMGELGAAEDRAGARLGEEAKSIGRQKEKQAAADAAKQAALDERSKSFDAARESYIRSLSEGAQGRAAAGGAQRDYVGSYNPYASSTWAQQQGGWEAQQLKNAGGTNAQQQGVWDAYTSKGDANANGTTPYGPMRREMAPFAPDKED